VGEAASIRAKAGEGHAVLLALDCDRACGVPGDRAGSKEVK